MRPKFKYRLLALVIVVLGITPSLSIAEDANAFLSDQDRFYSHSKGTSKERYLLSHQKSINELDRSSTLHAHQGGAQEIVRRMNPLRYIEEGPRTPYFYIPDPAEIPSSVPFENKVIVYRTLGGGGVK